ncbi:AlbA family DNA-binding domain-containing protein [Psychromonas aquimarina]|uniref:AlbA family DNA-binding domain-containing protein n=1 Tax=Psychromonas aquimarina TaxID=444919 RepID=UPI0004219B8A|nr:ATP-binding protein [Psychromonas aquimarina]
MERCRDIFNRIKDQGLEAIESFVEDRASEELFLDFKRSADNGAGRKLHNNDRNNFSKCVSGFGNSEGGVVVWGVDCSNNNTGADVAHTLVPLEDPKKFLSLLEGVVSGCTIPPHSGVEQYAIETEAGAGYVVTLIPKSNSTPHQMVQKKQYYIRAGSDFVPAPHDVLAGMFGRRPQPHVFHHFILPKPTMNLGELKVSFGTMLHNEGPGIAQDLFAICLLEQLPGDNCQVEFETPDRENWTGMWEFDRQLSAITKPEVRLPPGANLQPFIVHISLAPPFDRELVISGSVGASNTRQYQFKIDTSFEMIQKKYELFAEKALNNSFSENEEHEIATAILKDGRA